MAQEGWDGIPVREHVERAAGEAARAHQDIETLCEEVGALGRKLDQLGDWLRRMSLLAGRYPDD